MNNQFLIESLSIQQIVLEIGRCVVCNAIWLDERVSQYIMFLLHFLNIQNINCYLIVKF
jgi:hypothetical protein